MAGAGRDEGSAERRRAAQLDPAGAPLRYAGGARPSRDAAGPAEAWELVDRRGTLGAAVAVAARRDAGAPRRRVERPRKAGQARQQARRPGQLRLVAPGPVRTAAVAAIAVLAASTAAAAGTGTLPVIFHTPAVARPAVPSAPGAQATPATSTGPAPTTGTGGGGPTAGRGPTTGGPSTTGGWPGAPFVTGTVGARTVTTLPLASDAPGQGPLVGMSGGHADLGLCTAFLASEASASGAAPATPAFGALVAAHGGTVT